MHADMWGQTFADHPLLGAAGEVLETRLAPLLYRRSRIVTLSSSSKKELVDDMGFRDDHIDVVPPGIDARFTPADTRSEVPLVVAVGRLVPVKRYDVLINVLVELKRRHPELRAVIASDGYERPALEELRSSFGADGWIELPGWLSDDDVVALYRRAWVLASASSREGWDMSVTEAAACGTPAVVTDIAGHRDAVDPGRSGYLARGERELVDRLDELISDDVLRKSMGEGAIVHASRFTWDATAYGTFAALAHVVRSGAG
jgi:glycosyltransferase involved in cell wall biosynthesis